MSLTSEIAALRRTASLARAARAAIMSKMRSALPSSQPTTIEDPPIDICPLPQPISADLVGLGIRITDARSISVSYERAAMGLKAEFEAKYAAARSTQLGNFYGDLAQWKRTDSLFAGALNTRYLTTLERWRTAIMDKIKHRVLELKDAQLLLVHTKKSFNIAAIPTLEKFFATNPRPSRPEKQRLATQTGMEHKQISVWFQNRRNRSKKGSPAYDGLSDANGDESPLPADLAAALARILERYVVPGGDLIRDERDDLSRLAVSFAPFHVDRPEHAWPACFPPLCSQDPFPISADARRLSITWYRFPVQSPTSSSACDESHLLALLQQWSLGSEDTDLDHHIQQRRTSADVGLTIRLPLAPISAAACTSQGPRQRGKMSRSVREACVGFFRTSNEVTRQPVPTKVEDCSVSLRRQMPRSPDLVSKLRRRCRARSHTPPDTLSLPSNVAKAERLDLSSDTLVSEPRGRPYPKGKPFLQKRSMPKTSQQRYTRSHASLASAVPSMSRPLAASAPSSPPTTLPALSRGSSISSLRSVSSTSSLLSDSELLLTPPSIPTSVLDYPVPDLFDLSKDTTVAPVKGLDVPRGAAYLGYSLTCGNRVSTLEMSSALYSQLAPAAQFFPEPPLIPTISPLVLVL